MAKILFGWELGQNSGHLTLINSVGQALLAAGHGVCVALKPGTANTLPGALNVPTFVAPKWPGRPTSADPASAFTRVATSTMEDILLGAGLGEAGHLSTVLKSWDQIFAESGCDLVIAEYAPGLLTAAAGRIPSISIGTGFTSPPYHLQCFPRLTLGSPRIPNKNLSDKTGDIVNAELRKVGRPPIEALPVLFQADLALVGSLPDFDPYRRWRKKDVYVRSVGDDIAIAPEPANRDELFVYTYNVVPPESNLWRALAALGFKIRLHMKDPSAAHIEALGVFGIVIEIDPVPFAEIAARSKLVVSHGGHGLMMNCLHAGIPYVGFPFDLEKTINCENLKRLGLGEWRMMGSVKAGEAARTIDRAWGDSSLHKRCIKYAYFRRKADCRSYDGIICEYIFRRI